MGWFDDVVGRLTGASQANPVAPVTGPPAPPNSAEILAAARAVEERIHGTVPPAVEARVHRISMRIAEMVPRLDRMGIGNLQAHTVVATATSYLPEAVEAYLRLPRDFADRRVIANGKTSLMVLCDQLDLLAVSLGRISDAVSRADANALLAHGEFLASKFATSSLAITPDPARLQAPTPQGPAAGTATAFPTAQGGFTVLAPPSQSVPSQPVPPQSSGPHPLAAP